MTTTEWLILALAVILFFCFFMRSDSNMGNNYNGYNGYNGYQYGGDKYDYQYGGDEYGYNGWNWYGDRPYGSNYSY